MYIGLVVEYIDDFLLLVEEYLGLMILELGDMFIVICFLVFFDESNIGG